MDLITSDGSSSKPPPPSSTTAPPPPDSAAAAGPPVPVMVERKSKKGTLMQIQSDTLSAAKAAFNPVRTNIMPYRQKKKVLKCAMNLCFVFVCDYLFYALGIRCLSVLSVLTILFF